jgi:hypothetical protein
MHDYCISSNNLLAFGPFISVLAMGNIGWITALGLAKDPIIEDSR